MNSQRRMFRGRGGPNDRRLPKHNARRRRPNQAVEKADQTVDESAGPPFSDGDDSQSPSDNHEEPSTSSGSFDGVSGSGLAENDESGESESGSNLQPEQTAQPFEEQSSSPNDDFMNKEIEHLRKRIRNNSELFSLSKTGLATVESYQMNVLNAVCNCFVEWKGILRKYPTAMDEKTSTMGRSVGRALFELLQKALQCGPLAGSKPGYFKRCGSQVATMVHAFLFQIIASPQEALVLYFTEKQIAVVEAWKVAALKVSEKSQSPSKSVQQRQSEAIKNHQSKKNKRCNKNNSI